MHYALRIKNFIADDFFAKALSFFVFFSLPLGMKKFLFPIEGKFITSETDGAFLFLNDIWIIILLFLFSSFCINKKSCLSFLRKKALMVPLAIFVGFSFLSIFVSTHFGFSTYFFIRLVLGVMFGFLVYCLVKHSGFFSAALGLFLSALVQSFLGLLQFISGKSVGLRYFGEVVVNETTQYVARTSVDGAVFLRAYGTMQHANILAAFLIIGFLAGAFLFYKKYNKERRDILASALIASGLFIIALGVAATFSRSGWIAAFASGILFLGFVFFNHNGKKAGMRMCVLFAAIFVGVITSFGWAIIPRASLERDEPSVELRVDYLHIGSRIITDHPFFGVGIGNQTDYAKEQGLYAKFGVSRPRDFQPIHNIFILVFSEIGIFGVVSIGIFFAAFFARAFRNVARDINVAWLFSSVSTLFIFGLFDHFPWTTQSGIAMFWVLVFLLALSLEERVE